MRSFVSDACGVAPVASLPATGGNGRPPVGIDATSSSVAADKIGNPPVAREPGFLTIREAAGVLRVSESTIRNAINSGQLRAFRFGARGGSIRITQSDLDDFIASAATASPVSHTPSPTGGQFKHLNASKLLAAWRQQGVLGKQHKEPTS